MDNAYDQMDFPLRSYKGAVACLLVVPLFVSIAVAYQASAIPSTRLINPDELVKIIQSSKGKQPLVLQVGSYVLYGQAHIPGSEYIGAASTSDGIQQLRKRAESLPRNSFIVIYCGCCPWNHCPNMKPADDTLREMGFTNVKVLYIAGNFGTDWVEKGYPTVRGQ